jgi:poly-gamma-glutamate capsule biosynthesis protein CapA/YwtB (metallophosphatase superfamily)/outer membrane protein assembly factor BamB
VRRLLLLVILLSTWCLASCGPTPAPPVALEPTATNARAPTHASTPADMPTPTSQPSLTPTPSATPSPRPTFTAGPTSSVTPAPTNTPTPPLPPVATAEAGQPLPLALDWYYAANGHLTAGRAVHLAGKAEFVVSSLGRTVYALTGDGEVAWRAQTLGPVYDLDALAGDRVVAGDDAGHVTMLDAQGQRLWRYDLGSRVVAVQGLEAGGVVAGGWDERLSHLNSEGELLWQVDAGGPVVEIAVWPTDPDLGVARRDLALVATLDGQVRAFDGEGSEVWQYDAGGTIYDLEAVDGAGILVGVQDGRLLVLDRDGEVSWQQSLGPATGGSPVWHAADLDGDAAPEVVVGTGGGSPQLALLSAQGDVLWRVAVPSPVGAVVSQDLDGDRTLELVVGLASGAIGVYDEQGRLRSGAHAGLPVWGLEASEDGSVLVLADVVAWRLAGGDGKRGGSWLPPPRMVPSPLETLPPGAERGDGEAILVFLGDVSPGRTMEAQLTRYGPAFPWDGLRVLLDEADLAVANLEGVLTTRGKPLDKSYLVRAHPTWGQTLSAGGLDLVTLANNHALDYGPEGLDETLDVLEALGIATVGAGRSQEEAHQEVVFALNGARVAVLAYAAARWNSSADVPATDRLAWAEIAVVQRDVATLKEVDAAGDPVDVVIVLLHAGTEYAAEPSPDQVAVARAAVDAGADLVVGHHPHVTQTIERYGDGLIVYGLGDALFDIPRKAAMQGDLLRVHITPEGLTRAELWPFWISEAIQPRFLADEGDDPIVETIYP